MKLLATLALVLSVTVTAHAEDNVRVYHGMYTEHWFNDHKGFNEDNYVTVATIDLPNFAIIPDRVAIGTMVNSYNRTGSIKGLVWENTSRTTGITLSYGIAGSNSYRKKDTSVMQGVPLVWYKQHVISPIVGIRFEPTLLIGNVSGLGLEMLVMGNAINVGASLPINF